MPAVENQQLGAGNENRTRIASLEGWSFTIKLCPRVTNATKRCHEVTESQVVFPGLLWDKTVKMIRGPLFPSCRQAVAPRLRESGHRLCGGHRLFYSLSCH